MDHKLKSLMNDLSELAKSPGSESDASVVMFESKIYDYLSDLREAVRSERKRASASLFWITVEEYIDRLKPRV